MKQYYFQDVFDINNSNHITIIRHILNDGDLPDNFNELVDNKCQVNELTVITVLLKLGREYIKSISKPKKIQLVYGDYYDDGHGKYDNTIITCSHTVKQLFELETKFEEMSGYRFQTNGKGTSLFNNYEEGYILLSDFEKLLKFGADIKDLIDGDDILYREEKLYIARDVFPEFFLQCLKSVDNTLTWKIGEQNDIESAIFNCRGYGLF